ncbi:hypothetical protein [Caballeronia ptereochthonis]|uniref:Uncharacterized protein n=1 Tax=Caballeronia ptereochthonis TaxID=1777144 RepID=A0A158DYF9_9BURK|nr:hypothetical protein [Caballeronia ptereochthonis]SAK99594.1 hypothetical protein AWB83_06107 [Caballeronia ptereochthonis]
MSRPRRISLHTHADVTPPDPYPFDIGIWHLRVEDPVFHNEIARKLKACSRHALPRNVRLQQQTRVVEGLNRARTPFRSESEELAQLGQVRVPASLPFDHCPSSLRA